jgi:hypothetical protein
MENAMEVTAAWPLGLLPLNDRELHFKPLEIRTLYAEGQWD